jgi:hypothetical protein
MTAAAKGTRPIRITAAEGQNVTRDCLARTGLVCLSSGLKSSRHLLDILKPGNPPRNPYSRVYPLALACRANEFVAASDGHGGTLVTFTTGTQPGGGISATAMRSHRR